MRDSVRVDPDARGKHPHEPRDGCPSIDLGVSDGHVPADGEESGHEEDAFGDSDEAFVHVLHRS